MTLLLDDAKQRVLDVAFDGRGCAISQASASILTDELRDMTVDELRAIDPRQVIENLGVPIGPGPRQVRAAQLQGAAGRRQRRRGTLAGRGRGPRRRLSSLMADSPQQGNQFTMTNDQTRPFREVTAADAVALAREGYHVIDVREQSEWDAGHVAGATLLPLGDVPTRIAEVAPDKDSPLLLHCAVGGRSARARRPAGRAGLHRTSSA